MTALSAAQLVQLRQSLFNFPNETAKRGKSYYTQNKVELLSLHSKRITAIVEGTELYETVLAYSSSRLWQSRCSCPIRDRCKHAYALSLLVLDQQRSKRQEPFVKQISKALGRPPKKNEQDYINRIKKAWTDFKEYQEVTEETLLLLQNKQPSYHYWRRPSDLDASWKAPPENALELLGYAAAYLAEKKLSVPALARELVDIPSYQATVKANLREESIQTWKNAFEATVPFGPISDAKSAEPIEIAFIVGKGKWEIHARERGKNYRKATRQQLWTWAELDDNNLSSQAIAFLGFAQPFLETWQGSSTTPKNEYAKALLLDLLHHPELRAFALDRNYRPLRIHTESLFWKSSKIENGAFQEARIALTLPDGSPLPAQAICLAASEFDEDDRNTGALYLIDGEIYPGPHLIEQRASLEIPWESLASEEGITFLKRTSSPVPLELESALQTITPTLLLQARLEKVPSSWGNIEGVVIQLDAIDATAHPLKRFTLNGWESLPDSRKRQNGEIIQVVDPQALLDLRERFAWPSITWTPHRGQWSMPLDNSAAFQSFGSWLQQMPDTIDIELSPELAGLDRSAVNASYEIDVRESKQTDWFDVSLVKKVDDTQLSDGEMKLLLDAPGRFVKLPSGQWRRLEIHRAAETEAFMRELSLSDKGETLRLHTFQLDNETASHAFGSKTRETIAARLDALRSIRSPNPPKAFKDILRPYQKDGFRFLCLLSKLGFGGILADDMGLGKTLQTLCWLAWLRNQKRGEGPFRCLVVCPKSVMDNWALETQKFNTGLKAVTYSPKSDAAAQSGLENAHLVIANYTQLRNNADYFESQNWTVAILDEGQFIKNPSSQTARAAYQLPSEKRLVLTGTPIENKTLDLWSLMRFAMPGILGSKAKFKRDFNEKKDPEALARLARRIKPFILRRAKSQVAQDLPPRIEEELHCELEGQQANLYRAELKRAQQLLLEIKSKRQFDKSRFNILQSLLRLRQICCDPRLLGAKLGPNDSSAKVQALLDHIEPLVAEGHKVLIFSQFVKMLELLQTELKQVGIAHLTLTGKTENRQQLVDRFQEPDTESVFLLSLKAAGTGLNLTAASYVVLFDPWWNPAVEAQAIDRTHRIGQKSQVIAYRLIAKNTIEEKIRKLQDEKSALAGAIVDDESLAQTLGLDDIKFLLADEYDPAEP